MNNYFKIISIIIILFIMNLSQKSFSFQIDPHGNGQLCKYIGFGCPIHELSINMACGAKSTDPFGNEFHSLIKALKQKKDFFNCDQNTKKDLIYGVRLPDFEGCLKVAAKERYFGNKGLRKMHPSQIVVQHIHSNPLPLVLKKGKIASSPYKQRADAKSFDNSYVLSYITNQQFRNQILMQSSLWYCTSIAAPKKLAFTKLGSIFHMLGDSFSASHLDRKKPINAEEDNPCGDIEQGSLNITQAYSMDVVSWKHHAPADADTTSWNFKCLIKQISDLLSLAHKARDEYSLALNNKKKVDLAHQHMNKFMDYLCTQSLVFEKELLNHPAGGADAQYSSAISESKGIYPEALASIAELKHYMSKTPNFMWYGPRKNNLCTQYTKKAPTENLPPLVLRCTLEELLTKEKPSKNDKENEHVKAWSYLEKIASEFRSSWFDTLGVDVIHPENTHKK